MSGGLPISRPYNLNRLGQAGDTIDVQTSAEERASLAKFADVPRVDAFRGQVELKKLAPNRFQLDFSLAAEICQTCVVTLADVPARIERRFSRELHFNPALHRGAEQAASEDIPLEDDIPEEIGSLHYDLAGPLVEEFVLAIDPYPRAPGVEFEVPGDKTEAPESPFAVLKGLKSGL
jgi:uncharacterized protein DUF177 involved in 23S rRNA accumulation